MTDMLIFVDLQGFIVNDKFTMKEIAVLRNGKELTHHIFRALMSWDLLTKSEKSRACWLTSKHHQLNWTDGDVDYKLMRTLVRNAVCAESLVYVKGYEKKKWLAEILENDVAIETIDADYEDIGRLRTLKASRAFRCGYHAKNCALENVCKLYDWWSERRDQLRDISTIL
ncbi:hypothetical protein RF55_12865 [Lasius niger]|uniref:Uncharacterized protein n=1 Tax=Lasius niger TaxID=67767 RepID=A0A0J7KC02_LASNI|nr:hypothetical protein RF55_12865 [Lasius niger]